MIMINYKNLLIHLKEEINFLNFTNIFCNSKVCAVGDKIKSFYYDDDHLSLSGSEIITEPAINYLRSNIYLKDY